MISKEQLSDEDSYEFASKRARLLEPIDDLAPVKDLLPPDIGPQKSSTSDSADRVKCQVEDKSIDVNHEGLDTGACGSISQFGGLTNNINEPGIRLDTAPHLSFLPEYFESGHHIRALFQSHEVCTSPVDYPLQKLVSVGPAHQTYVPEWHLQVLNSSGCLVESDFQAEHLQAYGVMGDADEEKMMGTCLIPMPDLKASSKLIFEDGRNKSDCRCFDAGSVRCVKQHIVEARDQLRQNSGEKLFEDLGFNEMGEEVAKQWTEEEERAFHEVVHSNSASLGKNFWHHLVETFPSRTHKDLVSYYFNVFMLRKRAEQNRSEPINIDSDNDEWQTGELELPHCNRHSMGESPLFPDASAYCGDSPEDIEGAGEVDYFKDCTATVCGVGTDEEDEDYIDDGAGTYGENSFGNFRDNFELLGEIPNSDHNNDDIDDASCTLYQQNRVTVCGEFDEGSGGRDARDCSIS